MCIAGTNPEAQWDGKPPVGRDPTASSQLREFVGQVQAQISASKCKSAQFNFGGANFKDENIRLVGAPKDLGRPKRGEKFSVNSINFNIQALNGHIELRGISANNVNITVSQASISLVDCKINQLALNGRGSNLKIEGSWVGKLYFPGHDEFEEFLIAHSGVLKVEFGNSEVRPFGGDVAFRNVVFPRSRTTIPEADVQAFRNLGKMLMEKNNTLAAGYVHSVELALERKNEPFFSQFVSHIYEKVSDFGNSSGRPVLWIVGAAFLNLAIIYWFESADLTDNKLYGWQQLLACDPSIRAAYLAVQPIINPLGLFRGEPLVIAANGITQFLLFLQSVVTLISVPLFFLALRRRFKMG